MFLYHKKTFLANLDPRATDNMKTMALGLNLVYSFINFMIRLPATYVRHSLPRPGKAFSKVNIGNC